MQIFIIGTPLETAILLDNKRFHRQLSEAKIILNAIYGENGWKGPLIDMYRNNIEWLKLYINIFEAVKSNNLNLAKTLDKQAFNITPIFQTQEYIINMRRRLYSKDPIYYNCYSRYGKSDFNMYWVNEGWKIIKQ